MKREYTWKESFKPRLDPQVAGDELERIKRSHGGRLTPRLVCRAASDEVSPLHSLIYHVKDTEAARIHYEERARLVMRSLFIRVVERPTETVHSFINVREGGSHYATAEEVGTDPALREQYLSRLRGRLVSLKQELGSFTEFSQVVSAIEEFEDKAA